MLDGFRVARGLANGAPGINDDDVGGGLRIMANYDGTNGSVILENCTFELNVADTAGGAVYLARGAIPNGPLIVRNCTFDKNSADEGGAFFGAFNTQARFTNVLFSRGFLRKPPDDVSWSPGVVTH